MILALRRPDAPADRLQARGDAPRLPNPGRLVATGRCLLGELFLRAAASFSRADIARPGDRSDQNATPSAVGVPPAPRRSAPRTNGPAALKPSTRAYRNVWPSRSAEIEQEAAIRSFRPVERREAEFLVVFGNHGVFRRAPVEADEVRHPARAPPRRFLRASPLRPVGRARDSSSANCRFPNCRSSRRAYPTLDGRSRRRSCRNLQCGPAVAPAA